MEPERPGVNGCQEGRNIVAFGEILWDLLPAGPVLGGAPFNFAFRMATLGHRSWIASRLGEDELGRRAFERATAPGLDRGLIQWDEGRPTGTVPIVLDAQGVPDFTIVPDVAYDFIEIREDLLAAAAAADCFCFGTLVQRGPVSRRTLHAALEASVHSVKLLDVNLRRDCYSPDTVRESLRRADILKLNEEEAGYVAGLLGLPASPLTEFGDRVIERCGLDYCVITLGPFGVLGMSASGERVYEPGRDVPVKDTCGSGDGLTAAFADALLEGESLETCCRVGNAMGSLVATQAGATEPVSREALESFLSQPPAPIVKPALGSLLRR